MRFAQRSQGFHAQATQQVEVIEAETPAAAGRLLSEILDRFAVQVVSLSHWQQTFGPGRVLYGITVVLEEEPDA